MANGFIRIPRTFYESDLWNPDREYTPLEAFLDLTRRINFDSRPVTRRIGGRQTTYGRDEVCLSVSYLVKAWCWTPKRVRVFLKHLEDARLIRIIRQDRGGANIIHFIFSDNPSLPADSSADTPYGPSGGSREGKPYAPETAVTLSTVAPADPAPKGKPQDLPSGTAKGRKYKNIDQENKNLLLSPEEKEKEKEKEGVEAYGSIPAPPPPAAHRSIPTLEEVEAYCRTRRLTRVDVGAFCRYYEAKGWCSGGEPIHDWRAVVCEWNVRSRSSASAVPQSCHTDRSLSQLPPENDTLTRALAAYHRYCHPGED